MKRNVRAAACWLAGVWLAAGPAAAGEALVAVAANFKEVADTLEAGFEAESGHELSLAAGSTGQLYAQIAHGAPFDVFLAADQERPAKLEAEAAAVAGSRFTYAVGKLTLWSADETLIAADGAETLRAGKFRHLAIANPEVAPYGAAALEVLKALGLDAVLKQRIVQSENIGQVFAHVATGNAELGFVALSSVLSPVNTVEGSRWDVPPALYTPIRQDAVLLARAADNPAAQAFVLYLKSEAARAIIEAFGYGLE